MSSEEMLVIRREDYELFFSSRKSLAAEIDYAVASCLAA